MLKKIKLKNDCFLIFRCGIFNVWAIQGAARKGGDITKTKTILKLRYKLIWICLLMIAFIYLINCNMLNGFNLFLYELNAIVLIKNLNDLKYY